MFLTVYCQMAVWLAKVYSDIHICMCSSFLSLRFKPQVMLHLHNTYTIILVDKVKLLQYFEFQGIHGYIAEPMGTICMAFPKF